MNPVYSFDSYKLMVDIISLHGGVLPVEVDRSTLHRWRASGRVPPVHYWLAYHYGHNFFHENHIFIDFNNILDFEHDYTPA